MTATHSMGSTPVYCLRVGGCSLLTRTFNGHWCDALNEREHFTHFAMMHDDVMPMEPGWLDVLMGELEASRADILSTVIAIKDERGLTSTAFWSPKDNRMRRLTMTEAAQLPPTFDAKAAGFTDCHILPNTGLWVCDFTKPWVEKICFKILDRNFKTPEGKWVTQCFSEDWHFGIQAAKLGLRVCATTAVKTLHKGTFDYPNFAAWGGWKTDEGVNCAPIDFEDGLSMPQPLYEPRDER